MPFLDPAVVKASAFLKKDVLSTLAIKPLLKEIVDRPKTGFSIPVKSWMAGSAVPQDLTTPQWAEIVLRRSKFASERPQSQS